MSHKAGKGQNAVGYRLALAHVNVGKGLGNLPKEYLCRFADAADRCEPRQHVTENVDVEGSWA